MFKYMKFVLAATAFVILSACGGGGGSGSSSAVANAVLEGSWTGSASTGETLNTVILENGANYTLVTNGVGTTTTLLALDQGTSSTSGNTLTGSYRAYLLNNTSFSGTYSGTAITGTSISGTTNTGGTFSQTPTPTSVFNYNTPANISNIAFTWSGKMLDGSAASVTISSSGAVSGTNGGCTFTGTAAPRATGKNVFDVSVTFGPSPCVLPSQTATGIATSYAISGTTSTQFVVAVQDSTKAAGTVFFAAR